MPEISHVRFAVPEQASLNRILREGGAQLFPQWLYAEPGDPRILWWGVRGAPLQMLDVPDDPSRAALFPRAIDDWTEAPRGLILATTDAERAAAELAPALGSVWLDAGEDDILGARCRRMTLGRSTLVLAEAAGEAPGEALGEAAAGSAGYVAACLEAFGEGPVAVALDGTAQAGRQAGTNPVSGGPATYVQIGPGTAPTLIFLPVR